MTGSTQQEANEQHYEVPTRFFELMLGPHLRYSSALWRSSTSATTGWHRWGAGAHVSSSSTSRRASHGAIEYLPVSIDT